MQVKAAADGAVVTIEAAGSSNQKVAAELERLVLEHLGGGSRRFIIDLERTELITGAFIRALVLLSQQLREPDGSLVLCSPSDDVRRVLEVAGLNSRFQIARSREDARALIAAAESQAKTGHTASRLSRLVGRLLEPGASAQSEKRSAPAPAVVQALAGRVAGLLAESTREG